MRLNVESSNEIGIITSIFHADGEYSGALRVGMPAGKSGKAISPAVIENKERFHANRYEWSKISATGRLPGLPRKRRTVSTR